MNQLDPGFYLGALQFLWLIALTLTTWLRKPGEDAGKKISEFQLQVSKQDQVTAAALQALESKDALLQEKISHLPTDKDIRELIHGMADLRGKLDAAKSGLESQQATLSMIQEFLNKLPR